MPYLLKTLEQAKAEMALLPHMEQDWHWLTEEVKNYNVYAEQKKLSKRLYLAAETETKVCVFMETAGLLPNPTTDIPHYTLYHDETGWYVLGECVGKNVFLNKNTRHMVRRQMEALLGISKN